MFIILLIVVLSLVFCALGSENLNAEDTSGIPDCVAGLGKLMLVVAAAVLVVLLF